MTTFLLIVLPLGGVIAAVYEAWLLRRGRGSWQALVSGVLAYGLLSISVIAGSADEDVLQLVAAIIGTLSLIWHIVVTRKRHHPTTGPDTDGEAHVMG